MQIWVKISARPAITHKKSCKVAEAAHVTSYPCICTYTSGEKQRNMENCKKQKYYYKCQQLGFYKGKDTVEDLKKRQTRGEFKPRDGKRCGGTKTKNPQRRRKTKTCILAQEERYRRKSTHEDIYMKKPMGGYLKERIHLIARRKADSRVDVLK